jgi:hypothetical protein
MWNVLEDVEATKLAHLVATMKGTRRGLKKMSFENYKLFIPDTVFGI